MLGPCDNNNPVASPLTTELSSPYASLVAKAFGHGLDAADGCFLHGTSLATLRIAMSTGSIPGGLNPGIINSLYFFPLPSRFEFHPKQCELPANDQEAILWARLYAHQTYQRLELLNRLGVAFYRPEMWDAALCIFDNAHFNQFDTDPAFQSLRESGLTRTQAAIWRKELASGDRRGVVLLLSKSTADLFEIQEAAKGDEGLKIACPNGLPIELVVGIDPNSDLEWQFLETIQDQVGK